MPPRLEFQPGLAGKPATLFSSFKSLTFRLWDERRRKLVSFRAVKNRPPGARRSVWRFITNMFLAPGNVPRART